MAKIKQIVQQYIQEQTERADLMTAKMRRFGWNMNHLTNEDLDIWMRYKTRHSMLGKGIMEQIENTHVYTGPPNITAEMLTNYFNNIIDGK